MTPDHPTLSLSPFSLEASNNATSVVVVVVAVAVSISIEQYRLIMYDGV